MNLACRLRKVVRPKDPFARAYSSLPTRTSVSSSSPTIVASTFSRDPGAGKIGVHCAPDRDQRLAEIGEPRELRFVAVGPEAGVVPVLLAPARVTTGRLEVTVRTRADPHVGPRGRDRELADAPEHRARR